jgi:apolipoprotein N-acyltransferase
MPPFEAIPIVLLLTSYQGLEFAIWSWGVHRLARLRPAPPMALAAPLAMVAIEIVVPQMFPFYLGISQAWVPVVIQIADLTGPVGVTFVMLCVTGGLYDAARAFGAGAGTTGTASAPAAAPSPLPWRQRLRPALRPLILPAAVSAAVLGYGALRIHQIDGRRAVAPKAKVGMVQANVGIQEKWDPAESARLLRLHQQQSAALAARGADLLVWPESSYPYALDRKMERDFPPADARRLMVGFDTPTLFGAVTVNPGVTSGSERFPYNTALMMEEGGRITGKYDKVFLLLFGEYIPFYESIPWFTKLFPEASNFNRGHEPGVFPFRLGDRDFRLGPLICYEDILPGFTRRVAALDPNLLVNLTNDAWFGKTSEPYQHLALAVFRSVEHRLDMVRAVNTGVSAHVDAVGRVRELSESADPDVRPAPAPTSLLAEVALLDRGGLYARVGDLFGYACLAALAALVIRRRRGAPAPRRPRPPRQRRRKKG